MSGDPETVEKGIWSSAFLVVAVLAIVFTGYVLKASPYEQGKTTALNATPAEPVLGSAVASEQAGSDPAPLPEPAADPPAAEVVLPTKAEPPARLAPTPLPAATPVPASKPVDDPVLAKLAARAEHDRARLAQSHDRYTAQLLLACRPETVDRMLSSGAGSSKLYVLPARHNDDACFRVCFGTYQTPKDASAAADLPSGLRGKDKIGAVEIAKVIL